MANGSEGDAHSWLDIALHGGGLLLGLITGAWAAAWKLADRMRARDNEVKKLIEDVEKRQDEARAAMLSKIELLVKDMHESQTLLHRENIKRNDQLRAQMSEFERSIGQIEGRQESADRRRRERLNQDD